MGDRPILRAQRLRGHPVAPVRLPLRRLSAQQPPHPRALLLGLDLGPSLAVTGSLSGLLWLQAAHPVGVDASTATYSKLGLMLVPLTLACGLAALFLFAPQGF